MTLLRVTLCHEGRDVDLEIRVDGPALVGDIVDAVIEQGQFERTPTVPSFSVATSSETLSRTIRLTDANIRSGDRVILAEASSAPSDTGRAAPATIQVVEGPDAGRRFALRLGPSDIGRSEDCAIRIADGLASRHHARIVVADGIHVADLGSTNGVQVNGRAVTGAVEISPSDRVKVGGTTFHVERSVDYAASAVGPVVEFNRPPHVFRPFGGGEIKLPAPPDDPPRQFLPMIAALVPLLMGVALYFVFGPLGAMFMLLSPAMVIGSYYESRRSGRLTHKERIEEHAEMLSRTVATLDSLREEEITSRLRENPSAAETVQFVHSLSQRLWERHADDAEFLVLRVGSAEQESRTAVELEPGGSRVMRDEMAEIPPRYSRLPDVPAVADLREVGGLGIAGPLKEANLLARALMAQVAGLHAPSDVVVTALFGADEAPEWKWLSWLPHIRSPVSPIRGAHIGTDSHKCVQLANELLAEVERRWQGMDGSIKDGPPPAPAIVVLIDESAPLDRTRLAPLLEKGPPVGICFIWVGSMRGRLPRNCAAVVDLQARTGDRTLGFRKSGDEIGSVTIENLSRQEAEHCARTLAPVIEIGGREGSEASVPRSVALVDLLGGTEILDDPSAVSDRWKQGEDLLAAGTGLQLRAPIGFQCDAPLSIDIRVDGPHALVAGTTGAGKSELLQSYVASLAATHSARRVTFLLVDYKGGAAFKDCVNFPHVVGLVTDLNTSEVRRALVSLNAELRHRERILNRAGAKDLVELERMRHPEAPPTLFLIVDEFAALAKEVPEFIDGVVDVALRGRSLGIHLLLATQRPAGVVTPQIRANTSLRVALRVADDEDSKDVVGITDAAALDPGIPGRAIAKLGPRDPVLFQSAYAGGFTRPASSASKIQVFRLDFDRAVPMSIEVLGESPPAADGATDLQRLVQNVQQAHSAAGIDDPRRPWQPPLADVYDLTRLRRAGSDERLAIGVSDIPNQQRQVIAYFQPDLQGSLLVLGASGSGKTVLLRSIAAAAALGKGGATAHVYGLDFAGRGLEMLAELRHVGGIVQGHDEERVVRLLRDLRSRISERSERFATVRAGSLPEYRAAKGGNPDEPRLVVLVDGYAGFHAAFERIQGGRWIDWLTQLVSDGRQFGLHFVLTADRRGAFPLALSSAVPGRVILRLASQDEYAAAGVPLSILSDASPPGRALFDGLETQIALLGGRVSGDAQAESMAELGRHLDDRVRIRPQQVRVLPDVVALASIARSDEGFTIGLRDVDLGPAVLNLEPTGFLVAGPPRSGKTTALEALVAGAPRSVTDVMIVAAAESNLTQERPGCEVALGESDGASLLKHAVSSGAHDLLVVVDDLDEFLHTDVPGALSELLRVGPERNIRVAVSSDAEACRRVYDGPLKDIRASRSGLLLRPDVTLDGELVGVRLPNVDTTEWPPGRGYLAVRGAYELCHVGVVTA